MAYLLEADTEGTAVFIVGFSLERIGFKTSKLKFLSGIGYAIYVAAFSLEEDDDGDVEAASTGELDSKDFMPRGRLASSGDLKGNILIP